MLYYFYFLRVPKNDSLSATPCVTVLLVGLGLEFSEIPLKHWVSVAFVPLCLEKEMKDIGEMVKLYFGKG